MALLPSIIDSPTNTRPHQPLVIVQSSVSQTCLPVLRRLIQPAKLPTQTLVFCLLYPPASLIKGWPDTSDESIKAFDYTERIPRYNVSHDSRDETLAAVSSGRGPFDVGVQMLILASTAPLGPLNVFIDSVDTLVSDLASDSQTYRFIRSLLNMITSRSHPSTLILHLLSCPLLAALTQTHLSPTLTHIVAHPSALINHLASSYLAPPPPAGSPEKFWSVFIPVSERAHESRTLVYGSGGIGTCSGWGTDTREFVVELVVRGAGAEGRKRSIERTIEGWRGDAPEDLQKLDSLKSIWARKKSSDEKPPDPTQNVSFNLNLTPSQEKSKAQVPLPYVHEALPLGKFTTAGAILYEPDSADDIDDDDPDDDLDI
ncbi:hypothetical protein PAXRUDRAFT_14649 [Paxillus rubicundulus Ve08.2h10]|uniref:Elongator complex protein 5 n=1 Tax=Paxillus rubicundulus Ve08.2h10 TaxID=930991 RepID=A0A0D0DLW8_9AGAM|nr:hypothetical protein PAXRUDRAFT_14649 [Paxillus rubicundulus Ve08.2h10]